MEIYQVFYWGSRLEIQDGHSRTSWFKIRDYGIVIVLLKEKFEDDQNVVVGYAGYNVDMTV